MYLLFFDSNYLALETPGGLVKRPIFIIIFACILMTSGVKGQELTYINSILWNQNNDVEISGGYAYCAFVNGLAIFRLSHTENPVLVSQLFLHDRADRIELQGSYVYIANALSGLKIINIENPEFPVVAGNFITQGYCFDLAVRGRYAYLASMEAMEIVDISDPQNIIPVGIYHKANSYPRMSLGENYVILVVNQSSVEIIDITNPEAPTFLGEYFPGSDIIYCSLVRGNYLYVASMIDYGIGDLRIIDITDPTRPDSVVGTCYVQGEPMNMVFSDSLIFFALGGHYSGYGMQPVNISNPTNPIPGEHYWTLERATGIDASNDYVVVANQRRYSLEVYDRNSNYYYTRYDSHSYYTKDVFVRSGYAYVANSFTGFQIIDIQNPLQPGVVGSFEGQRNITAVAVAGDYAYLAWFYGTNKLEIVDISNPARPSSTGICDIGGSGFVTEIAVIDGYAYIRAESQDLIIVDISDPKYPTEVGRYNGNGWGYDVCIMDDYAYLADGTAGCMIIDISNKQNPVPVGSIGSIGTCTGIDVSKNSESEKFAYLVSESSGLSIIDVSNPQSPVLKGRYNASCADVVVKDNYAYLANYYDGISVVDISNVYDIRQVSSFDTPGIAVKIDLFDNKVFVCDGSSLILFRVGDGPSCIYTPGDVNNNHTFNGIDVAYSVSYLKGGPNPPYSCECNNHPWFVAGDVNGNCLFNGIDIGYMVSYFKGGPAPVPCPDCPPASR
jgi:hypothetical protein